MFNLAQTILFPFVSLPCLLICFLFYKYGKRALSVSKSFTDRMEIPYTFTASALLGQFLFQALPNSTGIGISSYSAIVNAFIMLGFFIMLCIQKCERFNHDNEYYIAKGTESNDIRYILNPDAMEIVEYFQVEPEDNPEDHLKLEDEMAELRKRRKLTFLLLIILCVLCIFEGFFLIYREPSVPGGPWCLLVFFLFEKMIESVIVSTCMLHAFYHATTERQKNWFLIGVVVWCLIVIASTIPVCAQMPYQDAANMVTYLAMSIFYALAGGVLFWFALYYIWIDRKKTDKVETFIRLCVFGFVAVMSWLCGYFV
jgi:hypothetical protein